MSEYEFSKQEEQTIASLGQRMSIVAGLIAATGIGRIIHGLVLGGGAEGFSGAVIVFLIIALVNVAIGIVFYRPTNNFKRIATTEGNDIKELMSAFAKLTSGFNLLNYFLIAVVVLLLIRIIIL